MVFEFFAHTSKALDELLKNFSQQTEYTHDDDFTLISDNQIFQKDDLIQNVMIALDKDMTAAVHQNKNININDKQLFIYFHDLISLLLLELEKRYQSLKPSDYTKSSEKLALINKLKNYADKNNLALLQSWKNYKKFETPYVKHAQDFFKNRCFTITDYKNVMDNYSKYRSSLKAVIISSIETRQFMQAVFDLVENQSPYADAARFQLAENFVANNPDKQFAIELEKQLHKRRSVTTATKENTTEKNEKTLITTEKKNEEKIMDVIFFKSTSTALVELKSKFEEEGIKQDNDQLIQNLLSALDSDIYQSTIRKSLTLGDGDEKILMEYSNFIICLLSQLEKHYGILQSNNLSQTNELRSMYQKLVEKRYDSDSSNKYKISQEKFYKHAEDFFANRCLARADYLTVDESYTKYKDTLFRSLFDSSKETHDFKFQIAMTLPFQGIERFALAKEYVQKNPKKQFAIELVKKFPQLKPAPVSLSEQFQDTVSTIKKDIKENARELIRFLTV